jgi:Holliday junction resolvasome RuvABC DNA-binding subunit
VEDALSALLNLGYKKVVAERAVERARTRVEGNLTLETLLKESLRSLG